MEKFLRVALYSLVLSLIILTTSSISQVSFTGPELLGKPTNNSITINIVVNAAIQVKFQYGIATGVYPDETIPVTTTANVPSEVTITGLTADTRYFYRTAYSTDGGSTWEYRSEYSFHTQRSQGSTFKFTIISDSHAQYNTTYQNTVNNVKTDQPDFNFDLGDTFMLDGDLNQDQVNSEYKAQRSELYLGGIGYSAPIFLSSGNHENEEGWNLDDTPFSIAVGSIQARKWYFPTPTQDGFYTGNTDILSSINASTFGDQLREDYYAFEWGDALFVVIDPFQYTMTNPYGAIAGEGNDDPASGDQWNWTLGSQQYNWFKQTIENSSAKYKFVFCHNMVGGLPRNADVNAGYVRGGAEGAAYFEWGGKNKDGSWGFTSHRNEDDFGTIPIHQLMLANGVSAYFHGHDHQYVYEKRDGIVYQEVPQPSSSSSGFSGIYTEGDHGDYQTIKKLPSGGHLRITVTPSQATVDYVGSGGSVNYTYNIEPNTPVTTYDLTMAVNPEGSGTTTPLIGSHSYAENAVVNITAIPNTGYAFDHW